MNATAHGHPSSDDDGAARARIETVRASARRHDVALAHGCVCLHEWGRGEPLVLLHGGSGSWTHWLRNIEHFAATRRVIAVDTPGLGDSDDPPAPYSADSLASIVAGALAALPDAPQRYDLAGFSFGGILAGHVAASQPHAVRRLIIVGAPPFGVGPESSANQVSAVDRSLDFDAAAVAHARNLRLLLLHHKESIGALSLRIHHDNLRRARLRSRKIARTEALAQALRRTATPLYGIWGDRDVTIHPSLTAIRALFAEVDPRGRVDVLDDVGHWVQFEASARFDATLEAQLEDAR